MFSHSPFSPPVLCRNPQTPFQGEPEEISKEKCRIAAKQVRSNCQGAQSQLMWKEGASHQTGSDYQGAPPQFMGKGVATKQAGSDRHRLWGERVAAKHERCN